MSNISHRIRITIVCFLGIILFNSFEAYAIVSLPEPDNAALLYYQALLLRPDFSDTYTSIRNVLRGDDPNEMVREYLNLPDSRRAISLTVASTKILDCSWGIMRYQGNTLLLEWRQLAELLEVDARTLAVDGEYRTALERCLSMRRFARHINDEGILAYLISMSIESRSLGCISYVLSLMPPDRDTLIWLQAQISNVQGAPPSPGRALEITLNDDLKYLSEHPEFLVTWQEDVSERIEDENIKQELLSLAYEEVLEQTKESYNMFLSSVSRVIGSDIPYQQKHLELEKLHEELRNQDNFIEDPFIFLFLLSDVVSQFDIYVRGIANFNVIRAAIEIYLVKEETGQLPENLPVNLPKDPFSNQEFEYEATNQGFVLRCREKEIGEKVWEYEFSIAQ